MKKLRLCSYATLAIAGISVGHAQQTGQPASNVFSSEDLWGNPTFVGGVTNGGPHSHSIW